MILREEILAVLKKAYYNARTDVVGEQNGNLLKGSPHALPTLGFMADDIMKWIQEIRHKDGEDFKNRLEKAIIEAQINEREKANYDVQILRPIFLTKDDANPLGDDPMAEKAVKIRNQLRKEIKADFDKRLDELKDSLKKTGKPSAKVCDRVYEDGGAYTAMVIFGVACCPSCEQPMKDHRKNYADNS